MYGFSASHLNRTCIASSLKVIGGALRRRQSWNWSRNPSALRRGSCVWIVQLRRRGRSAVLLKPFAGLDDVVSKYVNDVVVQMRPDHDAKAVDALCIRRHRVSRQHPAALPYARRDVELVEVLDR